MKKNIYTDGISRMKTPDELLNKSIENIRSAEVTEEVISFKTARSKRTWIKPLSAIAASLAIVIALGSVGVFNEKESNENPFVLTANAETLNTETYVKVGNVYINSGSLGYSISPSGETTLTELAGDFNFNVKCEGENIETITYSSDIGRFLVDDEYEGVVDYTPLTMEEMIEKGGSITGNMKIVSSCIFDYDLQPESRLTFAIPDESMDASFPLFVSFKIRDAEEMYKTNPEKYADINFSDACARDFIVDMFNSSRETYSVDITANFTDGSTATQTLQFKCVEDETGIYLAAILV